MALSNLLQGCSNKSDTGMINKNVTRLPTQGCNNTVISWLYRTCWNNLVTSLIISTRLLQVVNSLFQTCWQLVTSSAKTTYWWLVDKLVTRCEIFACVAWDDSFFKPWACPRERSMFCTRPRAAALFKQICPQDKLQGTGQSN
jgi:hypothetical protein